MIKTEIQAAVNDQIRQEFEASYQYLGMAAHFERQNLPGFAHWCVIQSQEETQHAMRLFRYLLDRGGHVSLEAIEAPRTDFPSTTAVFESALQLERQNTASINQLYSLAAGAHDHATISHLQWFLDEQVEEEKSIDELLSHVRRADKDVTALLYLNDKLLGRTSAKVEKA